MNEKWLKQQAEEISMALARSGIRWAMPVDDAVRGQKVFVTDSTNVAAYIDHTLLAPTASREQIGRLCQEALEYRFASVCVNPGHVRLAARLLAGSPVKTCTVIGFPLGATTTLSKVMEARDAVANGAQELDMVINVGALMERDYTRVYSDIRAVRDAAPGLVLKVILETGYLSKEQIVQGCILVKMAGADFVKTCTGFGPGKAELEDITLMREVVGPDFGVKASGGIRDRKTAMAMIKAGANRIGASAGVAIVQGEEGKGDY